MMAATVSVILHVDRLVPDDKKECMPKASVVTSETADFVSLDLDGARMHSIITRRGDYLIALATEALQGIVDLGLSVSDDAATALDVLTAEVLKTVDDGLQR
jgi:hypothetical protein